MSKPIVAVVGVLALVAPFVVAGCGSNEPPPAPPGPAVGTKTPGGGEITAEPRHGKRPRMAGG